MNSVLAILAFLSFALTVLRWAVSRRFPLHRRMVVQTSLPGMTLLKPLKGCDAETKRCLRSWLAQKYPGQLQVLFGVASDQDPVCAIVRELLVEFPQADAQLAVCAKNLGVNAKVSTLCQLEPLIRHPLVVISDADVLAAPDVLINVAPHFEDPGVGLVNCFFRWANPQNLAMRWEAFAMNADFWTQVLLAKALSKVDFAMGAVMALPSAQLKAIGGFAALGDFLADDYQLGNHVWRTGKRIEFATVVVDCWEPPTRWLDVWKHQLRWARTMRVCKPAPIFFSILENATLWPLLWMIDSECFHGLFLPKLYRLLPAVDSSLVHAPSALGICILFLIARIATAFEQQSRLTQSRAHFAYCWLAPVKDLLNAAIWAASFFGNHVEWRGERYRVLSSGKLVKEAKAARLKV